MRGILSRWVLSRVIRSAFAFETETIELYRHLEGKLGKSASGGTLHGTLCRLLGEEEQHWRILTEAAEGTLSLEQLEKLLDGYISLERESLPPLAGDDLAKWESELTRALEQEEKTWIFYGNLRRMSKIPAVKRAFEVLAKMEREHVAVLRRLLGRDHPDGG